MKDKEAEIERITQEVNELDSSPLYSYRTQNRYKAVIGEGSLNPAIFFVGEAPGATEAKTGRPFVGAAGRVLNDLLASIGLDRKDVYITNIVKDRPPENRDPSQEEIRMYSPFLVRQIDTIQPKVIATLGRFSMDFVLGLFDMTQKGRKISELHGKPLNATTSYGKIVIVPLFHPAVALYNREQKQTLQQDFQNLVPLIEKNKD